MDETPKLTDKEELFCLEYLVDLNKTKAYIRAFGTENYDSARATVHSLFAKPSVNARIRDLMNARADAIQVDAHYVLENLINVATRCQQEVPVEKWDYELKQMVQTGEYVFDSNGANKALELIGKHIGMFKDKIEVTTPEGIIILGKKFSGENNP